LLECINLLRIAPYVQTDDDHFYLVEALGQICKFRTGSVG